MSIKKKTDKVMDLLMEIAKNMRDCGEEFADLKLKTHTDLAIFKEKIKEYESKGDLLIHQIVIELNNALITPLDREDIFSIAEDMDNVVDYMEEIAAYFDMYQYMDEDDSIEQFRVHLKLCTSELCTAMEKLVSKKIQNIKPHTVKVKSYEETCDAIERHAIKSLFFEYANDPIALIKYKDLYELLEDNVDECQHVAKVFDSIVMKNA